MLNWIKVGQKVVCIRASWDQKAPSDVGPIQGQTYTIRNIDDTAFTSLIGLRFCEIVNPVSPHMCGDGTVRDCECSFDHECFRPVKKTSIEVFNKILRTVESEIPAPIEP